MCHLVRKPFPKAPEWVPLHLWPEHGASHSEGVSMCLLNE